MITKGRWITVENLEIEIRQRGFADDIDLLEIDGNNFWIWKAVVVIRPTILLSSTIA